MTDLNTHLRITVAPEEDNAKDGKLSQLSKSTLSANHDKPVLFVLDGGARQEWWTKGFPYCPWDAAVRIRTPNREIVHYNDSGGGAHRLDGPAQITYVLDPREERYEELWIQNGKKHRTDGPAITIINRPKGDTPGTWGETVKHHGIELHASRFSSMTPVKYSTFIDQYWHRDDEPFNGNNATDIQETGVIEVTQLGTLLGTKTTKFVVRREYNWKNADGKLSRDNGPAVIKLLGLLEVNTNGKITSMTYDDIGFWWYYNGTPIKNQFIDQWIESNGIKIGEAPYVDNSYFASAEDETCFLVDIISGLGD